MASRRDGPRHIIGISTPEATAPPRSILESASLSLRHLSRDAVTSLSHAAVSLSSDPHADAHRQRAANLNILDVPAAANLEAELRYAEEEERGLRELDRYGGSSGPCGRCAGRTARRLQVLTMAPSIWVYLLVLGAAAGLLAALAIDAPVALLLSLRNVVLRSTGGGFVGWLAWSIWCVAFSLGAAACVHWQPAAEGSGIPQLKSILAGTALPRFLRPPVALAKIVGLVSAQAAGLSIGKEGPFTQIAATVASELWRAPGFAAVRGSDAARRLALAAAVAAGVTGVFGTPVGALLFSIEVTSTVFPVASLPRVFAAAAAARLVFTALASALGNPPTLAATAFAAEPDFSPEMLAFAALGVVCGLAASSTVYCLSRARIARRLILESWSTNGKAAVSARARYTFVTVGAVAVATATYAATATRQTDRETLNALFSSDSTGSALGSIGELLGFAVSKFIATIVSLTLPVPCGLFTPLFTVGAALGRAFGTAIADVLPPGTPVSPPGVYALAGAAALAAGVTQTVSTLMLAFELTGQTSHITPVLVATMVSYAISGSLTVGVYDLLARIAGVPYLPRVLPSGAYALTAKDVAHSRIPVLTPQSTHAEALALLRDARTAAAAAMGEAVVDVEQSKASGRSATVSRSTRRRERAASVVGRLSDVPIVDAADGRTLLGTVSLDALASVFVERRAAEAMAEQQRQRRSMAAAAARAAPAEPRARHHPPQSTQAPQPPPRPLSRDDTSPHLVLFGVTAANRGQLAGNVDDAHTRSSTTVSARRHSVTLSAQLPAAPARVVSSAAPSHLRVQTVTTERPQASDAAATSPARPGTRTGGPGLLPPPRTVARPSPTTVTSTAAERAANVARASRIGAAAIIEPTPGGGAIIDTFTAQPPQSANAESSIGSISGDATAPDTTLRSEARGAIGYDDEVDDATSLIVDNTKLVTLHMSTTTVEQRETDALANMRNATAPAPKRWRWLGREASPDVDADAVTTNTAAEDRKDPFAPSGFNPQWLASRLPFHGFKPAAGIASGTADGSPARPRVGDLRGVDPSPLFVPDGLPLPKLHVLFATCLLPQVLVVAADGRLVGIVTRDDLAAERVRLRIEELAQPGGGAIRQERRQRGGAYSSIHGSADVSPRLDDDADGSVGSDSWSPRTHV